MHALTTNAERLPYLRETQTFLVGSPDRVGMVEPGLPQSLLSTLDGRRRIADARRWFEGHRVNSQAQIGHNQSQSTLLLTLHATFLLTARGARFTIGAWPPGQPRQFRPGMEATSGRMSATRAARPFPSPQGRPRRLPKGV